MSSAAAEAQDFLAAHPCVEYLDAFIIDLCGRAIGKRFPRAQIEKLYKNGSQFCASTYLLDVNGNSADPMGYGFSDGDPDADIWPVPGTLQPAPWGAAKGAQCLLTLKEAGTDTPLWFEPRVVLSNVAAKLAEMKLTPVIAMELEFYLIDKERTEAGGPQPPIHPRTGQRSWAGNVYGLDELEDYDDLLTTITQVCKAQNIPASTAISEYGAGQFEINLEHVDDPLKAADDAAFLRRAILMAAREVGYDATFLSKPYADLAGSGMHIHVSMMDETGANIFDPARKDGDEKLGAAIAGLQATMAEAMGFFAPNINAFRRFVPDQFTPVTTDWGDNNRSMAFRIPASDGANRRVEQRVSGADANPYLALAAVLAGACHGLKHGLMPTEKASGNAGAEVDPTLPLRPWSALERLESGTALKPYFGEDFLKIYAAVKSAELEEFLSVTGSREFEWYL